MCRPILLTFIVLWLTGCQMIGYSLTKLDEKNINVEYDQAMQAYSNKNWQLAEEKLVYLKQFNPDDSQVYFKLGNIYARQDKYEQAVDAYQEALLRDSENPKIWHNLGVVQLRQASISFLRTTQFSDIKDPLHQRSMQILKLYDEAQSAGSN